ncbi:sensor histidine kinase [Bombilactobacillus bombi]|uniref:sensor histidine kinase n=1 Tax=Bombilactobacillus bombi TaxID=1303590 RepID=UPI0015F96A07|nr:GHKL domain-containing protein [Bombilactobacillus bombi]
MKYLDKPFLIFINISLTILCTIQFTSYWIETFLIKKDNPIRIYMLVFFLILMLVLDKYLSDTVHTFHNEEIKELKDQQLLQMERYVNQIEKTYDQLRYFRHDFKNILVSMSESLKTDNIKIIRENYNNILKSQNIVMENYNIELIFPKLNNIKNMSVKSVLYAHLVNALQNNIHVNLEIEDPIVNEPIDTFDYVRILSILLDNATEEAEKYSDSVINIYFIKDISNNLTVIVENTFRGNYSSISKLFQPAVSSKGNNRGLGLASIEFTLNKYKNISLETQIENSLFTQKIIMKW